MLVIITIITIIVIYYHRYYYYLFLSLLLFYFHQSRFPGALMDGRPAISGAFVGLHQLVCRYHHLLSAFSLKIFYFT
jgi:hypothetical protein